MGLNKKLMKIDLETEVNLEIDMHSSVQNIESEIKFWSIIFLTFNASIGYFYFGYNLTIINTLIENLSEILDWNITNKTIFTSILSAILPMGAAIGAFFSGHIASLIGRRYAMILIDILGIVSNSINLIRNTNVIIVSRFFQGLCVGAYSMIVPLYVSEYVPKKKLGALAAFFNCSFAFGIFLSILFGLNLPDVKNIEDNWWRFMFAFPIITNIINMLLLLFYYKYDTPSYLINFQKDDIKATKALSFIYKPNYLQREIQIIKLLNKETSDQVSYKELICGKYSKRLLICLMLNIFQQTTLISPIGIYSTLIFLKSTDLKTAVFFSVMIGLSEVVGTITSIFIIEKLGRKIMFVMGLLLTCLLFLSTAILYFYDIVSPQKYLLIIFYYICGVSVDPIIWIYNADVMPDKGVGILAASNWITGVILITSFPFMIQSLLDYKGTFLMFSLITLIGVIFACFFMKETRGKNKVEIENAFDKVFN